MTVLSLQSMLSVLGKYPRQTLKRSFECTDKIRGYWIPYMKMQYSSQSVIVLRRRVSTQGQDIG